VINDGFPYQQQVPTYWKKRTLRNSNNSDDNTSGGIRQNPPRLSQRLIERISYSMKGTVSAPTHTVFILFNDL